MGQLQQTTGLLQLPNETLIHIIELAIIGSSHAKSASEWLNNLSQTCSHLNKLARPYYFRSNDYDMFYSALRTANVAMMDRCEYYNAAPIDKLWSRRLFPSFQYRTSIDVLLSNVYEDCSRTNSTDSQIAITDRLRERVFDGLKWLLERGADGATWNCRGSMGDECKNGCPIIVKPGHMHPILLKQLKIGTSKRGMDVIFDMIQMLSSHGFPTPTRFDSLAQGSFIRNIDGKSPWFSQMICKPKYRSSSPLGVAMNSHVSPSVLELILNEHASRGLKLREWHKVCPPSLAKLAGADNCRDDFKIWVEVTYIDELLGKLHADLHSKWTNWEESYFGEIADIFHEKLKLMIKYEMIDYSEEALLKSIEHALYDIAQEGMLAGRYDRELFKRSWEMLGEAVMPFATDVLLVIDSDAEIDFVGPGRIHRYAISSQWNPWKDWFLREYATESYNPEDTSSIDPGTWRSAERYQNYIMARLLHKLPDWHTMSLDDWCHIARFEVETDILRRRVLHGRQLLFNAI